MLNMEITENVLWFQSALTTNFSVVKSGDKDNFIQFKFREQHFILLQSQRQTGQIKCL